MGLLELFLLAIGLSMDALIRYNNLRKLETA